MAKEIKYEEALSQLEDIVSKMENEELDIDELTTELKQAQKLVKDNVKQGFIINS